jgi:ABC-2 type transport system permease protein
MAVRAFAARLRTAAWLGWQIESNWTDPFLFVIYTVVRPLATALIIAGMYWAVGGQATHRDAFPAFYLANAFHVYVTNLVVGMGWLIVEEREDFETLKYVYASPIGMFTYLAGRGSVKLGLATVSALLALAVGWVALGVRWDWAQVPWLAFAASLLLGLTACVYLGFLVAGAGLLLPRISITINEGLGVALYLLCGVLFPVDMLPRGVRDLALALPFTYWYEALRRFLLGHGASRMIGGWSDGRLLATLALTTLAFALVSRWGYGALERRARQLGRLDQGTLF